MAARRRESHGRSRMNTETGAGATMSDMRDSSPPPSPARPRSRGSRGRGGRGRGGRQQTVPVTADSSPADVRAVFPADPTTIFKDADVAGGDSFSLDPNDGAFLHQLVTDEMRRSAKEEVRRIKARLNLADDPNGPTKLWGNRPISKNTERAYTKHCDGLRDFCILIGDYESLLILDPVLAIPRCPAMKKETLHMYINYKVGARGSYLIRPGSQTEEVHDAAGNLIQCEGSWLDPKNVQQFKSAVSVTHFQRGNGGSYHDSCSRCCELQGPQRAQGCEHHLSQPQLWRAGNPTRTPMITDMAKKVQKDMADYFASGDNALSLTELLRIRTALLSRCTRQDLQLWVMMLLSVKLFLRSDEVLNLALDEDVDSKNHILWNNSSLGSDGVLEFLAFKIRGKSDKAPITLLLARDDAFPELCPIRALMHYVHTCNIKKGFLFPPADMLNSLTAEGDGNCASPISYESYNKRLKEVCERVIGRSARIGTHSMRKTAYFLAVWAGANEIDARQAARHATSASAIKYMRDASTQLEIIKRSPEHSVLLARLPKWTSPFVGDSSMAQSFMRRIPQHNLLHHARHFVLRLCGLGNRLVEPPIAETAEAILKYQDKSVTLNGIEKDLRNFGLNDDQFRGVMTKIQSYIAKVVIMQLQSSMPNASGSTQSDSLTTARIAAPTSAAAAISTVVVPAATAGAKDRSGSGAVQAVSTNLPPSSVTSAIAALSLHTDGPNSESTDPPPMERSDVLGPTVGTKRSDDLVDQSVGESGPPTKKKKRGGDIRLVARRDVLLARGASCILDAVIALDSEMKDLESRNKKSLVMDDDRQFYNRTRPFLCCFQNHFHSQRETFVSAVGTVSLTGFKKKCSGVGDSCGFGGTVTSGKSATHSPIN